MRGQRLGAAPPPFSPPAPGFPPLPRPRREKEEVAELLLPLVMDTDLSMEVRDC